MGVTPAAIVTGAAQGIGRAFARAFAAAGYAVVIADLDALKGAAVVREIEATGGSAVFIETDVSDAAACRRLAERARAQFERIDVLVNNAAVRAAERRRFWEIDEGLWDRMMAVNVKGVWLAMSAVVPAMREQRGGCIINMSSAAYLAGAPNFLHYTASKAAVVGMTRSAARELGEFGIRVNAILPGSVTTEIAKPATSLAAKDAAARNGGRIVQRDETPADLVGVALFLASEAASYITGQSLNVDGGQSFL